MLVVEGLMDERGTVVWDDFMGLRVIEIDEPEAVDGEVEDEGGFGLCGCGAGSLGRVNWIG
jgi:hypothetical protein